jgi:FkbM family methyltransferase
MASFLQGKIPIFFFKITQICVIPYSFRRWRLPLLYFAHTRLNPIEPEIGRLARFVPAGGVAIDAGANAGLYSYGLSRFCRQVHSFEINPAHCRMLRDFGAPNVEIHGVGLSNASGETTLHTPVLSNGMILESWASLEKGNCPGVAEHLETRVRVVPLDEFEFPECVFLKIDVEGHELQVLEGAKKTLRRTRPRILVEVREENIAAVDRFLESLEFRRAEIRNLIGREGAAGNFFYLPMESSTSR